MNETHFVSAGGNLILKPKSARILGNRKCSSEEGELVLLSPKANSSTSCRIADSTTSREKAYARRACAGNEPSKSDQGAAGRRRVAREKLANSDHTPKQAPTDGLYNSNPDQPRSKREVHSNSNHDDKKRGHSRPRSSRSVLSASGHGRRSDQSPAPHLLSNGNTSHGATPVPGLSEMINQQLQHLQQQFQLLQQQQQQQEQEQNSQHQPQQQPQGQEGGRPRSRRNVLSNSGHSRNKSHSSGASRSQSNPRRRRGTRDEFSKISDRNSPTSSPPTKESLSKSDHGGRRTRRHNDLGASCDPKTTTLISSECMEIKFRNALGNQANSEFSVDDEKKWDLGKSWGFESFGEAEADVDAEAWSADSHQQATPWHGDKL